MMSLWLQLFFLIGIPLIAIVTNLVWVLNHIFLTPIEAKRVKKAARKKRPLVALGFDNGQSEFKVVKEIGDEGYIRTDDDWIGFLPRPIAKSDNPSNPNNSIDKAIEKTTPIMTKVFTLKDAKIPILYGYAGKALLTNPQVLATLEHAPFSEKKEKRNLPFGLGEVNIFWHVDLRTIKSVFGKSWNQAQVRALEKKKELVGMLKGKKYFGMEGWKTTIMGVSIILALGIILVLVMVLAPRVL